MKLAELTLSCRDMMRPNKSNQVIRLSGFTVLDTKLDTFTSLQQPIKQDMRESVGFISRDRVSAINFFVED